MLPEELFHIEDPIMVNQHECKLCFFGTIIFDSIQFLAAVIVNLVLYSLVVFKLRKRQIGESNVNHSVDNVIKMVLANSLIFFICLIPLQIVNLNDLIHILFNGDPFISVEASSVLRWLGRATILLNSSINPLVYSMTNPRYRKAFFDAFNFRQNQDTFKSFFTRLKRIENANNVSRPTERIK